MRGRWFLILAVAITAWAANVKLYLKDGGYQLVREYQVQSDRVRFYSVERSEWEEVPLDLVDLKRTEAEAASHEAELAKEAKLADEENQASRQRREEIARIPADPGVYWTEGSQTKAIERAVTSVHTEVGKSILRHLSPTQSPVSKTATLEIPGAHSANVFTDRSQEFYLQLSEPENFGIARLTSKGAVRVAENIAYIGGTDETDEQRELVDTLQMELAENLYKIWPKEPLPPGEYAVVQYADGKIDMRVWDFAVRGK
jgi:hypothetical protein